MKNLIDFQATTLAISLVDLLVGLTIATVLGLVIVFIYRWTHRGLHYERSFLITLATIPGITGVVMMLIGSNLALSLGMVGALSIIRFRTVIKDSRDMVFLFFAISVGLGCGTYNWTVMIVATAFLSVVLLILHLFEFGSKMHSDYALVLSGDGSQPDASLRETIKKYVDLLAVRSVNIGNDGWEMVFEVRFFKTSRLTETDLFERLKTRHGVDRISFLAPQLSLPL